MRKLALLLHFHLLGSWSVCWWYRGWDDLSRALLVGAAVLGLGVAIGPIGKGLARRVPAAAGKLVLSSVLAISLATVLGRTLIGLGPIPGCTRLTVLAAKALGLPAVTLFESACVRFPSEQLQLSGNALLLGLPYLVVPLALAWAHRWAVAGEEPRLSPVVLGLLVGTCLLVVRLIVVLLVASTASGFFAQRGGGFLWEVQTGWISVASCALATLPALLILGPLPAPARPGRRPGRGRLVLLALAGLGTFAATTAWLVPEAGRRKPGRILIDDSHAGDWELGGVRFTPEWRGDMSVYACGSLSEHLGGSYHVRVNREHALDVSLLEDVDVLVLRVPDRPFSSGEIDAIREFVEGGGGLLAVGDHTDLFGCNTYLDQVLGWSGLRMLPTGVSTLEGYQAGLRSGLGAAWAEAGCEDLQWLSGCSVRIGIAGRPVIVDTPCIADRAVWCNSSYFGDRYAEPGEECGPLVLVGAREKGLGRVIAFGDGTLLTNFGLFRPGRLDLVESIFAYLNRRASRAPLWRGIALLATVLGVLAAASGLGPGWGRPALLLAIAAAVWGGLSVARSLPAESSRMPPRSPMPVATFLGNHAHYHLAPTIGGGGRSSRTSFDTLFVEFLRYGIRPRFNRDLEDAIRRDAAIVVPNVMPVWTGAQLDRVDGFVRAGGVLWLLASDLPRSVRGVQQVLQHLGLADEIGNIGEPSVWSTRIEGLDDSTCVTLALELGRGLVLVTSRGEAFSREGLGHPFPVPAGDRARRFEALDEILGRLASRWGRTEERRFGARALRADEGASSRR